MAKVLIQTSGVLKELATLAVSAGAASSGGIPQLNASGILDSSFLPSGLAPINTKLFADQATSGTTQTTITGLNVSLSSGVAYSIEYLVVWQAAASTTGVQFSFSGPATSVFAWKMDIGQNANTDYTVNGSAYAITGGPTASGGASVPLLARMAVLITPSAAGTFSLLFASRVSASAVTIKAGSVVRVETLP